MLKLHDSWRSSMNIILFPPLTKKLGKDRWVPFASPLISNNIDEWRLTTFRSGFGSWARDEAAHWNKAIWDKAAWSECWCFIWTWINAWERHYFICSTTSETGPGFPIQTNNLYTYWVFRVHPAKYNCLCLKALPKLKLLYVNAAE